MSNGAETEEKPSRSGWSDELKRELAEVHAYNHSKCESLLALQRSCMATVAASVALIFFCVYATVHIAGVRAQLLPPSVLLHHSKACEGHHWYCRLGLCDELPECNAASLQRDRHTHWSCHRSVCVRIGMGNLKEKVTIRKS